MRNPVICDSPSFGLAELDEIESVNNDSRYVRQGCYPFTDEALIDEYLTGLCGVLAGVLHADYGWPVYGVFSNLWTNVPQHVGVRRPADGAFIDSRGFFRDAADFLNHDYYRPRVKPYRKWFNLGSFNEARFEEVPGVYKWTGNFHLRHCVNGVPKCLQIRDLTRATCRRYDVPRLLPELAQTNTREQVACAA